MRIMYDSVQPSAIPVYAEVVMGYVDGKYAWKTADWNRFSSSVRITCSAIGVVPAHVLDVEPGCVWPPENAVPWVVRARIDGYDPAVYCNWQNHLHLVRGAFDRAGVAQPHYLVAKYDGIAEIPDGTLGKQYMAPESGAEGHYDVSSIVNYWPGVDQATEVDDLSGQGDNILGFLASGGPSTHVNTEQELRDQGVDPTSVFGRLADVQWALTANLPIVPQINERLTAMGEAIGREIDANDAFRVEMRAAITAAPAGGALDVERVSQRVAELVWSKVQQL